MSARHVPCLAPVPIASPLPPVDGCQACGEAVLQALSDIRQLSADVSRLVDTHSCHIQRVEEMIKSQNPVPFLSEISADDQMAQNDIRFSLRPPSPSRNSNKEQRKEHVTNGESEHLNACGRTTQARGAQQDQLQHEQSFSVASASDEDLSNPSASKKRVSDKKFPIGPAPKQQQPKRSHTALHNAVKLATVSDPVSKKARLMRRETQSLPAAIVKSTTFEIISVGLVLSNAILIGVQVQIHALERQTMRGKGFIDKLFCIAFTLELLVRLLPEGYKYFLFPWNMFDAIIVAFMLLEQALFSLTDTENSMLSQMSVLRVVRVLRIIRVLRVLRVLKFFTELRVMLLSIFESFKSLVWAMCILSIVFYIFGITFTQGVIDHCESIGRWDGADIYDMQRRFGSIEKSALSLFEAMSGGISWGELVDAMQPLSTFYTIIFLCFISLAIFAIVNIVTGVFVEGAMQNSRRDRELVIQDQIKQAERYEGDIGAMFAEMDDNSNGAIGLDEFQHAMQDERMVAYFNALGIDLTDACSLFKLLDRDQRGDVDIDEFLEGCKRLRGAAKSMDIEKLLYASQWMMNKMAKIEARLSHLKAHAA